MPAIILAAFISLLVGACAEAESPPGTIEPVRSAAAAQPVLNEERIFGVIPNYQTVSDPSLPVRPLTARQKWVLLERETLDPFNLASAALGSGFSQMGDETPKYGQGGLALGKRFGAALADAGTQNLFSAGVLACLLHQDPRYFRKGPSSSFPARVAYSASRIFVARQDSGRRAFNTSGIGGMALGIAASNIYYPPGSATSSVMTGRVLTSLLGGVLGNLMSEFWPDLQPLEKKLLHWKR